MHVSPPSANSLMQTQTQGGVSLVELVIAMGLLSVVVLGVTLLFLRQNDLVLQQDMVANIQRDTRLALSLVADDIKMAGARTGLAITIGANEYPLGIAPHDDGVGCGTSWNCKSDADALTLVMADETSPPGQIISHTGDLLTSTSPSLDLMIFFDQQPTINNGETLVITRGTACKAILEVTNTPTWDPTSSSLSLEATVYDDNGPIGTSGLGNNGVVNNGCGGTTLENARLSPVRVVSYWVEPYSSPPPGSEGLGSLRYRIDRRGPYTLADDIETLTVDYFLDQGVGNWPLNPTAARPAAANALASTDLDQLRQVRIVLVGRTRRYTRSATASSYQSNGAPDVDSEGNYIRHLRRRFTRLVTLRNAAITY